MATLGSSAREPRSATAYAWYVALVLAFAHLVSFVDRFLMALVLAPIKDTFQVSDTQLGLVHGTGFVILYCIVAIPLGRYVDVANRRNIIIAGIIFWSLATAACGLATSFNQLFFARIAVGLGEACLVPAALSLLSAYFPGPSLGRGVAVFSTGATAGGSAALIGGGALLGWLTLNGPLPGFAGLAPWQAVFVLAALPGLIGALALLSVREPARPATVHARATLADAVTHVRAHARAYACHIAATCAVIILYQAFAAWTPTYLVRHFALTIPQSGLYVGLLLLVAGPGGNLFGGYLIDRFQRDGKDGAPALTMAIALAGTIFPGAIFCLADDLGVALAAWAALTASIAVGVPAALSGIQMITPDSLKGVTSALFLAIYTLVGVGLGPTMVGLLTDHVFGHESDTGKSLLTILVVVALLGTAVALAGRRSGARAREFVECNP